MEPHDADSADTSWSGLGFTGLTAFGPAIGPAPEEARLPTGTQLDDVTIVRFVAEGGMGFVYEGRQGMPARSVAVKVLRPGSLSPTAARRFLHEAQLLGRLSHPGIAHIYSVGMHRTTEGTLPYFVMEYVEDATAITTSAAARSLSLRDRVKLFREVCQAVAHGHQRGVIHRDLKPSNILVSGQGRPKVIDFGVARSTDGDVALTTMHTALGQLVGTLRYMSPEQFEGNTADIDVRADVYALGIVLYELLTGRLPYDVSGKVVYEVSRVVREIEPTRLGLVDRRLRGDLETIVATCLDKDRSRRYSSAAELDADLGRWLDGEPIAAARPGLGESLIRLARRHRLAATAAAAVTAAVFAGTAGVAIFAVQADRARQQATRMAEKADAEREAAQQERDRADAEADMSKKLLVTANLRSIQAALDDGSRQAARQLLAETVAMTPGPPRLEARCLAADVDDAIGVIDIGGPVASVGFSPDGRTIGATFNYGTTAESITHEGMLPQMRRSRIHEGATFHDLASGHRIAPSIDDGWATFWQSLANGGRKATDVGRLATSADATQAVVYGEEGRAEIIACSSGRRVTQLEGLQGRLLTVEFSPDGRRVAAGDLSGEVVLWNVADGTVVMRIGGPRAKVSRFGFSGGGTRFATAVTTADAPDAIFIHDTTDGRLVATISLHHDQRATEILMAMSHDGSHLGTASRNGTIDLWNTATGERLAALTAHHAAVEALAFSRDGERLASGSADGRIVVWNVADRALSRDLTGHDGMVQSLAFHPDGARLASGSVDGTVRIWQTAGPPTLADIAVASPLTSAAFSPDGSLVALACERPSSLEIWRVATVERVASFDGADGRAVDIAWSPDGQRVAAAFSTPGRDGEARIWPVDGAEPPVRLMGHASGAVGVTFTPDGTRLVTTAGDGLAMAWEASSGQRVWVASKARRTPSDRLRPVLLQGGRAVAHGTPSLLDTETGGVAMPIREYGRITCLAADRDGEWLASGMALGVVYLVTARDGAMRARLVGHLDAVSSAAFSADGRFLATGSVDGTARIWATDGRTTELACLSGHGGVVEAVAFSPDGDRLLTAASDGRVRLWDPSLGRLLCIFPAAKGVSRAAAISPDGRTILAGGETRTPRLRGLSNAQITAARRNSRLEGVVGQQGQPLLPNRLLERGEKGREIGEVLAIEAERPEVR